MAKTKANNNAIKIKDKETKRSTCHDIQVLSLPQVFQWIVLPNFL